MKVAYLGPEKTFTEKVARELFAHEELIPILPIRRVVRAVDTEAADFGVVPLENLYGGAVTETLDSLTDCERVKVVKETSLGVVHCLGALKGHGPILKVLSKDQALDQCGRYLCEKYPEVMVIATSSTAEAAQRIAESRMLDSAAIGPEKALNEAGLEILAKDICPNNRTRFAILGRNPTESSGNDKTLLVLHPPVRDRPGVLYRSLGFFAGLDLNLETIHSRPDGDKGYLFYIEVGGHAADERVRSAIDAIRLSLDPKKEHPNVVKVLGSYVNTHWKGK